MDLLYRIPVRFASIFLMLQIVLAAIFHALVLLNVISYKLVWGGRVESMEQLITMESITYTVNVFLFWIIGQRSGHFKKIWSEKYLRLTLYVMALLFLLNTLGNALAIHPFEKYFFGTLTLISSFLCLRLAIKEKAIQNDLVRQKPERN